MNGFTKEQLIAHIMDKSARIKPDRQINDDHRREALMNLRVLEIALAALTAPSEPVMPDEMTPEMIRAVQKNTELGAYAAANLSGAYELFNEFWKEANRAAMQPKDGK